jgi:hypothetical protein
MVGLKGRWMLGFNQKDPTTIGNPVKGGASTSVALGSKLGRSFIASSPSLFNIVPVGFEKYFLDQTHIGSLLILTPPFDSDPKGGGVEKILPPSTR